MRLVNKHKRGVSNGVSPRHISASRTRLSPAAPPGRPSRSTDPQGARDEPACHHHGSCLSLITLTLSQIRPKRESDTSRSGANKRELAGTWLRLTAHTVLTPRTSRSSVRSTQRTYFPSAPSAHTVAYVAHDRTIGASHTRHTLSKTRTDVGFQIHSAVEGVPSGLVAVFLSRSSSLVSTSKYSAGIRTPLSITSNIGLGVSLQPVSRLELSIRILSKDLGGGAGHRPRAVEPKKELDLRFRLQYR